MTSLAVPAPTNSSEPFFYLSAAAAITLTHLACLQTSQKQSEGSQAGHALVDKARKS